MSKAVLANKTTERSQTAFCLRSATIIRLLLPLTFSVWHPLFPFCCGLHHTSSFLTLTHLATVSSIYTCSVLVSFFFSPWLRLSLPVTPVSRHRLALLAASHLRPPSRGWGSGRKAMTVHRAASRGHRAGLSQLSQETERDRQRMYSSSTLWPRGNNSLPSPKLLLHCWFSAQQYNLEVVARLTIRESSWPNVCHDLKWVITFECNCSSYFS